jgi:hypothetical protein
MRTSFLIVSLLGVAALGACAQSGNSGSAAPSAAPAKGAASFFITSAGAGKGADLGGLTGADAYCQRLAGAAGHGNKTWRAYLSASGTFASGTTAAVPAVHASERIGKGPWYNVKGQLIANDVAHLHNGNLLDKTTALDERGQQVKGRGDQPNEHDILTGSRADGTAFAPQTDTTCKNWTSSTDGSAIVGHHDRTGPNSDSWARSWNFSHQSAGCSQEALVRTGGSGRFYCFAAN